jgi:hypothetical protein
MSEGEELRRIERDAYKVSRAAGGSCDRDARGLAPDSPLAPAGGLRNVRSANVMR